MSITYIHICKYILNIFLDMFLYFHFNSLFHIECFNLAIVLSNSCKIVLASNFS